MLKIVRGVMPVYGMGEPVVISNKVYIPSEEPEEEEADTTEAEQQISMEQLLEEQRLEEQRRKEEEEAKERRIREEIEIRFAQLVSEHKASMERERDEIIDQAKRQAEAMSADARAATISVINKAEKECIKLKELARQEGHTEGYNEGYATGKEESIEKYKKFIDAAGKLLGEINSRKEAYYISNEEEMRDTVFELVQKITAAEIKTDPRVIDGIIGEAAKNFRNSDYIKITLAEDGISERYLTDEKLMRDIIPYIPEIEIEIDDEAEEGTVILDNGSEIVDAGIPTQLDFLKEILKNTRGESDGGDTESEEPRGLGRRKKTVTITADAAVSQAAADTTASQSAADTSVSQTAADTSLSQTAAETAEVSDAAEAVKADTAEAAKPKRTSKKAAGGDETSVSKPKKKSVKKAAEPAEDNGGPDGDDENIEQLTF